MPNPLAASTPARARRTLLWLGVSCAAVASGPRAAQAGDGVTLEAVAATTLARSPEIRLAVQQAEAAKGVFLSAGAPFDLTLGVAASTDQQHLMEPGNATGALERRMGYSLSLQKQLRQGILLTSTIESTRSIVPSRGLPADNRASVRLNVEVPLFRDRGGIVTGAPERAARSDYQAGLLGVSHATAETLYVSVTAYWEYLAASKALAVHQSSEARAERMLEETRVLVEADERTPADLVQLRGNLASKRAVRLASEQALAEARQRLGLAMGLPAVEIAALPPASTDFPPVVALATPAAREQLVAVALARRADLRAAGHQVSSAQTLLEATRNDLKSQLDLVAAVGYNGLQSGTGLDRLFLPFYRNVPGADASLQLRYLLPAGNLGARGRFLQSSALHEQRRVAQDDLQRRLQAEVLLACDALQSTVRELEESQEAVRLLEDTLQSEERKFRLGFSTLFDVLQAQDGLTLIRLAEIDGRRRHALSVAALRFQTGTLFQEGTDAPVVELERLLTPPRADEAEGKP